MEGQWFGLTNDQPQGRLIVDIDAQASCFRGSARLFYNDSPGIICPIVTADKSDRHSLEGVGLNWMPSGEARVASVDEMRRTMPAEYPDTADITLHHRTDDGIPTLEVSWSTNLGTTGSAHLLKSTADLPSTIMPLAIADWEAFKKYAVQQKPGRFIFRGQPETFKLRTAFHRSRRKDLVRYVNADIPLAHRLLTAKTGRIFDLGRAEEAGAFWNLLQHHGYPTPLLDWTYSPFVAAFFAYRRTQRHDAPSDKVRIYVFDKETWESDFRQLQAVNFADMHFSMLEALAIENPRAIPQQALSTLTNIDNIEGYVQIREAERSKRYLFAVDLPAALRGEVMVELSLMGITAGSLFPGIDGICEELRGRMFHEHELPKWDGGFDDIPATIPA